MFKETKHPPGTGLDWWSDHTYRMTLRTLAPKHILLSIIMTKVTMNDVIQFVCLKPARRTLSQRKTHKNTF